VIDFAVRGVLLDVEGTTSSVRYVFDVLFPFARREMGDFLRRRWDDPAVVKARQLMSRDAEVPMTTPELVCGEAYRLMDGDVKATGLKELQGLIWEEGYAAGRLRSHVFPDVPPALRRWRDGGIDLRIFSSGSVAAQKVFFASTDGGDLLGLFSGHYDTTTGPKREAESYRRIAADWELPTKDIIFLSDVPAELDAAAGAGMQTALVIRPGNAALPPQAHSTICKFDELRLNPRGAGL
jgi:enolase-phosphatase E1